MKTAQETLVPFLESLVPAMLRALCTLLIVSLGVWMAVGIGSTLLDLRLVFDGSWSARAERAILNALVMLAVLEVIRTLDAYIKLGRVRVTFILDTALVVLIGELIGLWFREYAPAKVWLGLGVIGALVVFRVVTARVSIDLSDPT